MLTERCNLSCSHCWLDSGPDKTVSMATAEAFDYIDQAREIPTVKWISITGGEPFLFEDTLLKVISFAKKRGFYTECVTNCFWAQSEKKAEIILAKLKEAGLEVINISTDDFHQRQLPFERVLNCYKASQRLGVKTVIMCVVARSSRLTIGRVVGMLADGGIQVIGKDHRPNSPVSALAIESGFIPAGRAAKLPESKRVTDGASIKGPCHQILRDVSIAPSGKVFPCCSALGTDEAFAIGNAGRERLRLIIQKASRSPLFKVLMNQGPEGLYKKGVGRSRKEYVNRCDLCYAVMTDSEVFLSDHSGSKRQSNQQQKPPDDCSHRSHRDFFYQPGARKRPNKGGKRAGNHKFYSAMCF
ncbi:MAG: radical SAM protein [Deltaproteobacteria bacterium]|nr:radical SAM protein [Deltaproteobacteria bacterium]MBW2150211.1 radical SAM protein [Deltaproteobacteria bacterium]